MQWLLSGIGQEEQFMPLVSFYCLLFCWGVLYQIKSHQDFIVFTPAYIPTVQLIKCCIYRHFKSTAQAFPTLFLMQTSYYLVSEMQKSMCQDLQLYYSFTGVVILNSDTTFLTEAIVTHNRKKILFQILFHNENFILLSDLPTLVFNVIFLNVRSAHVKQR